MHVLGIDAGATKTVCLLADDQGHVLAEARGPGANLAVDEELRVEKVLHGVMEEASRGLHEPTVAVCLGMAGVDRPEDGRMARTIMRRLGYRDRVLVVNDALLALVAGVPRGPGIVVIAGTGAIVYGRNARNLAARASGWGHLLDDEGSGYWIGVRALKAVMREADGRGPATELTPRILAHFGVAAASDLVHVVYYRDLSRQEIAALSLLVQQSHDAGDATACEILGAAASELAAAARSVTGRLGLQNEAFSYVLAGGVFRVVPSLARSLTERLLAAAPRSSVIPLDMEPAVGAVRLAIAEAEGTLVLPKYITEPPQH
jgi:N-acetylglucosamine kinase-like BadF-type ATPase